MKEYIGSNTVTAIPMNRLEYNKYRGWEMPADEVGEDEGYLVDYGIDDMLLPENEHHESWYPEGVFKRLFIEAPAISHFFGYSYLSPYLQPIGKSMCQAAQIMSAISHEGPEKSAGMRKLLEAKDCFIRSNLL